MRIRIVWLALLLATASCGKEESGGGGDGDKPAKPEGSGTDKTPTVKPKPGAGPVTIAVKGTKVLLNGTEISGQPKMADIEKIFGKPDRMWDTGSSNKVHTWDAIGLVAYEPRTPADGRCISTTFPYKAMGADYSPKTMFSGTAVVDGQMMLPTLDIATLTAWPGATQPYGKDSVMFDKGEIHVFTTVKAGSIDLIEISYWHKAKATSVLGLGGGNTVSPTPLYAGKYSTTEGWMTLKQKASDPTEVYGTYAKGSIKCQAAGNALSCSWNEGRPRGRAQFTREANGNMKGTWGPGQKAIGGGPWNCTLLSAGILE